MQYEYEYEYEYEYDYQYEYVMTTKHIYLVGGLELVFPYIGNDHPN